MASHDPEDFWYNIEARLKSQKEKKMRVEASCIFLIACDNCVTQSKDYNTIVKMVPF